MIDDRSVKTPMNWLELFLRFITNGSQIFSVYHNKQLSKHVPDHEDETETDDTAEDDGVASLAEVDLVHQAVDQRKLAGQIIQLGLHCLQHHHYNLHSYM